MIYEIKWIIDSEMTILYFSCPKILYLISAAFNITFWVDRRANKLMCLKFEVKFTREAIFNALLR